MKKILQLTACLCCTAAIGLGGASSALATELFSSNLDDSTGLAVLGTSDTAATFGYDYSVDGIPEAPNSVGGAATTGLKLEANISAGAAHEVAVVTTGLGALNGKYTVQAEVWVNANGPFPLGGSGSTEFGGIGVGHDGATAGRNGASLIYDGEGGSGLADYRLYKNGSYQSLESSQYAITDNNVPGSAELAAAFPGLAAPAAQGQGPTLTNDGSGGFQWMTILAEVDTNAVGSGITADLGVAKFTLTSSASGATLEIGSIDNSNGGTVVNMSGNASLVFADIFSSVSGSPQFSFGVYDNFVVTKVPEPTSLALVGLGLIGLLSLPRKRN